MRTLTLLLALALSTVALGQQLTPDSTQRIRQAYKAASTERDRLERAQSHLEDTINAYNDLCASIVAQYGFPRGTQFRVNLITGKVTPQVPPPPPPAPAPVQTPTPATPHEEKK